MRYALAGAAAPLAVADFTYDTLPVDQRASLPGPDDLTAIVWGAMPEEALQGPDERS